MSFSDRLLPAPVGGGFSMEGYWVWCGSVLRGEDDAVADRVVAEMKNWPKFEVISTNLSQEQDEQLRAEFGEA